MNKEKLYNLVMDQNVQFYISVNPKLKELVLKGEHPSVKRMRDEFKAEILSDKVFVIDNQDVLNFINREQMDEDCFFLLSNSDIRVVGSPSLKLE